MEKLKGIREAIQQIIDYPTEEQGGSADGYPQEVVYDKFAYERMVDSYRDGLRVILNEFKD